MLGQEEAVAAGLADAVLQGLPGAHRPGRQIVEEGGLLDPGDGALDLRPAARVRRQNEGIYIRTE